MRREIAPNLPDDLVAVLVIYPRSGKWYFCCATPDDRAAITKTLRAVVTHFKETDQ